MLMKTCSHQFNKLIFLTMEMQTSVKMTAMKSQLKQNHAIQLQSVHQKECICQNANKLLINNQTQNQRHQVNQFQVKD